MTTIILAQGYNSPGKSDGTGAFLPEARKFRDLHGGTLLEVVDPMTSPQRRIWAEHHISVTAEMDVLAVFGHGTPSRLCLTGHDMAHVGSLANAIRVAESNGPVSLLLYACLTGRGKTGIADALADRIPADHVWAHSTAGHTTWNPFVELAGGPNGGDPVFTPADGPHWRRWRERLREDQTYRLSFWRTAHGLWREEALDAVREEASR